MVSANLMTQPTRTTMDQNNNLVGRKTVCVRALLIQHTGNAVDLEKVVARPQRAQLITPALTCVLAHMCRVSPRQSPALFRVQNVLGNSKVVFQAPLRAAAQKAIQFFLT